MKITIEHHGGQYPSFNVNLHSVDGKEAFISIKGCRIVQGGSGAFVSYPSRKQDNGKYWNHVWASEGFNAEVLRLAQQGLPAQQPARATTRQTPSPATTGSGFDDFDNSDLPY